MRSMLLPKRPSWKMSYSPTMELIKKTLKILHSRYSVVHRMTSANSTPLVF